MKHPLAPILIGSDHAGYHLKEAVRKELISLGHDVCDFTPKRIDGDDYPIIGKEIAKAIVKVNRLMAKSHHHDCKDCDISHPSVFGIIICGSGVGVAMAANHIAGARAVEGFETKQVKLAREHEDANILTLGEWNTTQKKAMTLIRAFLSTPASKAKRHVRRIKELG